MQATIKNTLNGHEVQVTSTTNHPASSYGQPVWVDEEGNCYGQCKVMGDWHVDHGYQLLQVEQ